MKVVTNSKLVLVY